MIFEDEPEIKFNQDEHVSLRKPTENEYSPLDAVATSFAKIRSYTCKMESKRKNDPKKFKDV